MNERDAFLRAIEAAANDAAPRKVFADWLDENGEPLLARVMREERNPFFMDRDILAVAGAFDRAITNFAEQLSVIADKAKGTLFGLRLVESEFVRVSEYIMNMHEGTLLVSPAVITALRHANRRSEPPC